MWHLSSLGQIDAIKHAHKYQLRIFFIKTRQGHCDRFRRKYVLLFEISRYFILFIRESEHIYYYTIVATSRTLEFV